MPRILKQVEEYRYQGDGGLLLVRRDCSERLGPNYRGREWFLIEPDGTEHHHETRRRLCREHDLDLEAMPYGKYPDLTLDQDGMRLCAKRVTPGKTGYTADRSRYEVFIDGVLRARIVYPHGAYKSWDLIALGELKRWTHNPETSVNLTKHDVWANRPKTKLLAADILPMAATAFRQGQLPSYAEINAFTRAKIEREQKEAADKIVQDEIDRVEGLAQRRINIAELEAKIEMAKAVLARENLFSHEELALFKELAAPMESNLYHMKSGLKSMEESHQRISKEVLTTK